MTGYSIVRINRERLVDLLPLYKNVFGKNVKLEYFAKKFDTIKFGAEYIGFIAYDVSGQSAAYYGLFPCIAVYEGEKILSAVSGDTMTHSAHRGRGLFTELAKQTYELARQSGIKFAYGFPNQHSLKGSISLGWQYQGDCLRLYSLKLNTFPLSKIAQKINLSGIIYHSGQKNIFFPNSIGTEGYGHVLHDENYFRYKSYTEKSIISIARCRVWVKTDGALIIGDIEREKNFEIKYFLNALRKFAVMRGITEIRFMTGRSGRLDRELSSCLKGKDVFPVGHFNLDADEIDFTRMKYGMGDLDTF